MMYRHMNFRIYFSLFGWKENILFKQHIVHWCFSWLSHYQSSSSEGGRTHGLFLQTAVKQEKAARRSKAFKIFLLFFHFIAKTILVKCITIHLNNIFGACKGLLCLQFLRQTDRDPIREAFKNVLADFVR